MTSSGKSQVGGFGSDGRYRAITSNRTGYATPVGSVSPSLVVRGAVRRGDSGGPAINSWGELVGIVWGVRGSSSYVAYGAPLRRIVARLGDSGGSNALGARIEGDSAEQREVYKKRLAAMEERIDRLEACPCDGECVTRTELEAFARKSALDATRLEHTTFRDSLQQRFRDVAAGAASQAKETAAAEIRERLRGVSASAMSLTTLQVVLASLGIGGPVGLAVLGLGFLSRRRLRKRFVHRGRGGPRHERFPADA